MILFGDEKEICLSSGDALPQKKKIHKRTINNGSQLQVQQVLLNVRLYHKMQLHETSFFFYKKKKLIEPSACHHCFV